MLKWYLFTMLLSFTACRSEQATAEHEVATAPKALAVNNTNAIARDTIKPRTHYIKNTSRPKDQIEQQFPFDISLRNTKDKRFSSAELLQNEGRPTVLLFWLTTCYPCRLEMAAIEKVYAQWKEEVDFNLFAISTDFDRNFPSFAKMVDEKQWPWPAYNDLNREFSKVMPGGLNGLPQTFILDAEGQVVYHKRKYLSGDEHKLFAKLKEIAAK